MAEDSIAPGVGRANISRRQILSGATVASFAAIAAPAPPIDDRQAAWQAALDHYRDAERRYETFYRARWRPAHDAMYAAGGRDASPEVRRALMEQYGIGDLEAQSGELCGEQLCRMHALVLTPAPDLPALRTKLEISYRDFFADEDEFGEIAAALLADAERLISA